METKTTSNGLWHLSQAFAELNGTLMDNGGEVTPEVEEMLASIGEDTEALADNLATLVRRNKAEAEICDQEIKRLQALKKTRTNAEARLKEWYLSLLQANGIAKVETPTTKVTISKGVESAVYDEDALLAPFAETIDLFKQTLPGWVKVTAEVSKSAVKEVLQGGGEIEGAGLQRTPHLLFK